MGGEDNTVYNPYDILLFITNHFEFENYWWGTGNPTFLIELLKEQPYYIPKLENITASKEILDTFDIDRIDLVALLWQTGYLTFERKITQRRKIYYQLKVPNLEIQFSLNELFLKYLTRQDTKYIYQQDMIYEEMCKDSLDGLKEAISSVFASIPYENYANNIIARFEGYYASVVFVYFASPGFECIAEDTANEGRIDLTMKLPDRIVIMEFKVDQKEKALSQIKQKKYYQKYLNEAKANQQKIYLVGICFDSQHKNITEFEWQKYQ